MNETEYEKLRGEVFDALANRTPNTECLELLQLVSRFPTDKQPALREAFKLYVNPERIFGEDMSAEDIKLNTIFATMGVMFTMSKYIPFEIQPHEEPLMNCVDETLGITPSPEDFG